MDGLTAFAIVPILAGVAWMAFLAGQASKEYPSEEQMLAMLKRMRLERLLAKEVAAEVEKEVGPRKELP